MLLVHVKLWSSSQCRLLLKSRQQILQATLRFIVFESCFSLQVKLNWVRIKGLGLINESSCVLWTFVAVCLASAAVLPFQSRNTKNFGGVSESNAAALIMWLPWWLNDGLASITHDQWWEQAKITAWVLGADLEDMCNIFPSFQNLLD